MAVTVEEKWESRPTTLGDQPTVDLLYVVRGTDDDVDAHNNLLAAAPIFYNGLARQSSHVERIAEDAWEGTVRYGLLEPLDTGDSSFSFDTGGGTQHATQSLATVAAYAPAGQTAPNFSGAIGVTSDAVEGVDITVPVYNFTETHYIAVAAVTPLYKAALFYLTGSINNAVFRGFAAGEVLFLGASGAQRGQDDWEITYRFAASPNVTGLVVGTITGIAKRGWDYLWVRYADVEDTVAKVLVKRPVAVYVEQVYPFGDLAGLGIGT